MSITTKENTSVQMSDSRKELLKRTICKGATDDEMELFFMICKKTGLDPFMKQIYPVKRWSSADKREIMTMQTSIDGFRLIAERTGNYSPGREPSYQYTEDKELFSATAYVKKRTSDGIWHEVAATAYFEEYAQRNKEGKLTQFWDRMPHVMLAKCAESLALRKAFPAELSGIYTQDEMNQADIKSEAVEITEEKFAKLDALLVQVDEKYIEKVTKSLGIESIYDLPAKEYDRTIRYFETVVKSIKEESNESSAVA
jgi:phage recombination protein Bet